MPQRSADFLRPIAVLLASYGAKGEKLLFKYPYTCGNGSGEKSTPEPDERRASNSSTNRAAHPLRRSVRLPCIQNGMLSGFSDAILANLLTVKNENCGRPFELKVNDVKFVGLPWLLAEASSSSHVADDGDQKAEQAMVLFHVVFVLTCNVPNDVIEAYQQLSRRIAIALQHEETRCHYLGQQANAMLACFDEVAMSTDGERKGGSRVVKAKGAAAAGEDESPFGMMLRRCPLGRELRDVFAAISDTGEVKLCINNWIQINYCLVPKAHMLRRPSVYLTATLLRQALLELRPYHAILLTDDVKNVISDLSADSSPCFLRVIKMATPLKTLEAVASEADVPTRQVFEVVSQLVFYSKAIVIFPIADVNKYCLSADADLDIKSGLFELFAHDFGQLVRLADMLSRLSFPVSLAELRTSLGMHNRESFAQDVVTRMILWLLRHRLVQQYHQYFYLLPTGDGQQTVPSSVRTEHQPRPVVDRDTRLSGSTDTSAEDVELYHRLRRYFDGSAHIEEMMYRENCNRMQLVGLLEKFSEQLIACEHEDPAEILRL